MVSNTNPRAVSFDDVYDPEQDENDDRADARWLLIQAKHDFPDEFVPLLD